MTLKIDLVDGLLIRSRGAVKEPQVVDNSEASWIKVGRQNCQGGAEDPDCLAGPKLVGERGSPGHHKVGEGVGTSFPLKELCPHIINNEDEQDLGCCTKAADVYAG